MVDVPGDGSPPARSSALVAVGAARDARREIAEERHVRVGARRGGEEASRGAHPKARRREARDRGGEGVHAIADVAAQRGGGVDGGSARRRRRRRRVFFRVWVAAAAAVAPRVVVAPVVVVAPSVVVVVRRRVPPGGGVAALAAAIAAREVRARFRFRFRFRFARAREPEDDVLSQPRRVRGVCRPRARREGRERVSNGALVLARERGRARARAARRRARRVRVRVVAAFAVAVVVVVAVGRSPLKSPGPRRRAEPREKTTLRRRRLRGDDVPRQRRPRAVGRAQQRGVVRFVDGVR
eukprot:30013-Pelagococcus_subviridis.AAC.4